MARSVARRHDKKNFMATLSDVVRVGIYVRRSTDDENQPYSIEAQIERLLAYIASQPGWQLVDRFSDDASGATTERKDLQRALTAAHMGLIDVLLVLRVDRFSRDLRDLVMLLDELDQAGVVFRSATEPFDTATPMGRMLVQMLGTFAQFEREVIIDRVIAGMEAKAQQGKWKGGKRPYGYQVDNKNHILIIDKHEAVIVRLIFDLYTKDRLGARSIATILNQRGHRTTSEGRWSAQQILRILSNRVYLGELTFRNITKTDTHPAIIDTNTWTQAQTILDARGQNPAHRAANSHDYMLTGRLRCPQCGKAMIGTRATGRNKTYRYYTCYNLARYDTTKCNFPRLDADDIDTTIITALGGFYRNHHTLIHDVITDAQRQHHAAHTDRHTELANIQTELTKTNQAIDRYLTAFERGTLDETLVADRLTQLRDKTKQLRIRHDELTLTLDTPPTAPSTATLDQITEHITTIINTGSANQRKALIENLVDHVTITGPDRLIPVFRIPQPHTPNSATASPPAETPPTGPVRTPTTLVELTGLEPLT
jgi:site-specific DNA recombinase